MKHPKTFDYQCGECEEVAIHLVVWEDRDNNQACPECGGASVRLWSSTFSTEKCSKSIPGEAARGRFDHLRRKQSLAKEKAACRISGDRVSEKKIDKEIRKSNRSK